MEYIPFKLQAAIFLSTIDLTSKLKLAAAVQDSLPGFKSSDPLVIPFQAHETPPDLPHIQIQDQEGGWTFRLALSRMDLFLESGLVKPKGTLDDQISEICESATRIWKAIESDYKARGNRIALVVIVGAEKEQVAEYFQARYLNTKYGDSAHEMGLHILHKLNKGNYRLNQWVRIKALPAIESFPSRLIMEIDTNSVPDLPLNIDEDTVRGFFKIARELTHSAISEYLSES